MTCLLLECGSDFLGRIGEVCCDGDVGLGSEGILADQGNQEDADHEPKHSCIFHEISPGDQSIATMTCAASKNAQAGLPDDRPSASALRAVIFATSVLSLPISRTTSALMVEMSQRLTIPRRQLRAETRGT